MRPVTEDDVVEAIRARRTPESPIVLSADIKKVLNERGIEWGEEEGGWPLQRVTRAEVAAPVPRIRRWRCGPHANSPNGFSLVEHDEAAHAQAAREGWRLAE